MNIEIKNLLCFISDIQFLPGRFVNVQIHLDSMLSANTLLQLVKKHKDTTINCQLNTDSFRFKGSS